jgi:two-component sensor histidine kinase
MTRRARGGEYGLNSSGDVVRRRQSAVPGIVLGMTLLFCAALTLVLLLLIWQGYYERLARIRTQAESASHVVSVHAQWLLEASNQALRAVDRDLADNIAAADSANPILQAELTALPADGDLAIYGPDGDVVSAEAGTPEDIAEREFFTALRDGRDWIVSALIVDADGTNPRFAVARRLSRNGAFAGVAALYLDAAVMEDFWESLNLGANSTVSMVRSDGWLIARYPSLTAPLNLSDYVLFTTHLADNAIGSYLAAQSPADGVPRTVGYRTLDGLPVIALASISTGVGIAEFWRGVIIVLAIVMPLIILLAVGAVWLAGVMRRDERTRLQLAQASEDNKTLMREIHHRVKNNLQAVSSLVQLQPIPAPAKVEMSRRIAAMVSVHEHIYRSDQFANAQVDDYIKVIVNNAREGFDSPVEISMDLEPLTVDKDHAMPLGLVVSEVVSNAFKHAFPDGRAGRLALTLRRQEDGRGRLVIADNGAGFDTDAKTQGMGRRLIEGLVGQLSGEYVFENDGGTRFVLTFPLSSG